MCWLLHVTTFGQVCPPFLFGSPLPTITTAFYFSEGFVTGLTAAFPPDVEPFSDIEGQDFNDDYDSPVDDSAEGGLGISQPPADMTAQTPPERTVRVYIVRYTAYKTFVGD